MNMLSVSWYGSLYLFSNTNSPLKYKTRQNNSEISLFCCLKQNVETIKKGQELMEKGENKVDHGKRIDLALSRNTQFSWKNEDGDCTICANNTGRNEHTWKKQG